MGIPSCDEARTVPAASSPFARALLRAVSAALVAVILGGCEASTEPTLVDVPPDKVPPKRKNSVPSPRKHGPRGGVSPYVVNK